MTVVSGWYLHFLIVQIARRTYLRLLGSANRTAPLPGLAERVMKWRTRTVPRPGPQRPGAGEAGARDAAVGREELEAAGTRRGRPTSPLSRRFEWRAASGNRVPRAVSSPARPGSRGR